MTTESKQRPRRPRAEDPPEPQPAEPDEGDETDTEPPAEPEPDVGSIEAQQRKIDNARRKYRKDLEGIVGDLGPIADCPMCDGLAFIESSGALLRREDTEACPTCHGHGFMLTGSLVEGQAILPCPLCAGAGYRPKGSEQAAPPTAEVRQLPLPAQQVHGWWDPATSTFHPYAEAGPT